MKILSKTILKLLVLKEPKVKDCGKKKSMKDCGKNKKDCRKKKNCRKTKKNMKDLLLRRFTNYFRQKFILRKKDPSDTWCDFAFELRNYFEEWIKDLEISDFQRLKELLVTDQVKQT